MSLDTLEIVNNIPPDSVDVMTGGFRPDDGNEFSRWRAKFKNYSTYLTKKALCKDTL